LITAETKSEKATTAPVDMLQAYIGAALDVIGRAGFNYHFKSHAAGVVNPLAGALNNMVNVALENKTMALIQAVFPKALDWASCRYPNRS
jgi:hypothetical protein